MEFNHIEYLENGAGMARMLSFKDAPVTDFLLKL